MIQFYHTTIESIDFRKETEKSRQQINFWVESQSQGKKAQTHCSWCSFPLRGEKSGQYLRLLVCHDQALTYMDHVQGHLAGANSQTLRCCAACCCSFAPTEEVKSFQPSTCQQDVNYFHFVKKKISRKIVRSGKWEHNKSPIFINLSLTI